MENKEHDTIIFRNGYSATSPKMTIEYKGLTIDRDSSPNRYALLLGRVLTTENVN